MLITDNTIALVKETLAKLENIEKENAELEEKLTRFGRMLKQFSDVRRYSSDEFYKNVFVCIEPDGVMRKPIHLDEAITILTDKLNVLRAELEYGKKCQEVNLNFLNMLTEANPGISDEIKD